MALIIAGERSGVGKTTITLAILAFLAQQKNKIIQAFKVGPDYIDPMFHTAITGLYSRNLDPVLTSPDYVQSCFALHSSKADFTVIEGVMGLFDGVHLHSEIDYGSTAHIARILSIPVVLVLDCSRLSGSVAAIAHGFRSLDPRINLTGVILNRVASDRHLELLQNALNSIQMPIFGVVRRHQDITIPDRHLGLIPTAELPEITKVFTKLAHIAKNSFNWSKLFPLLATKPNHSNSLEANPVTPNPSLKIAVACDRAFNFYYQDNLDLLAQLGAEISFWSPLQDQSIPPKVSGFYFGGGFPEMFAEELASNQSVKEQLKQAITQNIPVYAECGGLMYLCDRLTDLQGKTWQMIGAIPATATMTSSLTLGYRQAFPLQNTSLINFVDFQPNLSNKTETIPPASPSPHHHSLWGHEFHRSQLSTVSPQPIWQLKNCSSQNKTIKEGWRTQNIHASYLHLHFGKSKFLLKRWLDHCRDYKN